MIPKQNVSVKQSPSCSYHTEDNPCCFPVLPGSSLCAIHFGWGLDVQKFLEQVSPAVPWRTQISIFDLILDKIQYQGPSRTIRNLNLATATINECDIQNWMLQNLVVRASSCESSRFRQCAVDTVEIRDSSLAHLTMESCSLTRLILTDCKLIELKLEQINAKKIFMGNCQIKNLIINQSTIEDIEFLDMENMSLTIQKSVLKNCAFPENSPDIKLVDCRIPPPKKI